MLLNPYTRSITAEVPDSMNKIPLVYILGFGHSGSTMLDLALGAMPNAESVGEIIRLRKEIDWNHPCTCGINLLDCPYWSKVRSFYEAKLEANGLDKGSADPMEFTKILRKGKHQEYFRRVFKGSNISAPQEIVEDYVFVLSPPTINTRGVRN